MAMHSPIIVPSCNAPQISTGIGALDDSALWLGQARAVINVLLSVHSQLGDPEALDANQLNALYAASTLMGWAEGALAIGHGAAIEAARLP